MDLWLSVRSSVAVLVISLLGAACGPTTTDNARNETEAQESSQQADQESAAVIAGELVPLTFDNIDPTSRDVAFGLVEVHGDEGGFVAFMSAFERGYDTQQIVDAALRHEIDSAGRITDGGAPVDPAGPRLFLIDLGDEEAEGDASAPVAASPGEVVLIGFQITGPAKDPIALLFELRVTQGPSLVPAGSDQEVVERGLGVQLIGMILELARVGYTVEQIIDAALFGPARFWTLGVFEIDRTFQCPALADPGGPTIVRPAGIAADVGKGCARFINHEADRFENPALEEPTKDAATNDPPAAGAGESGDGLVGVYNGYVRFGSRFEHANGDVICLGTVEVSITLAIDGAIRGGPLDQHTYFGGACGLLGRGKLFEGSWTADGALDFTMDGSRIIGSAVGDRLSFELLFRGGYVETTSFNGCATKGDLDPRASCAAMAAEFESGETATLPADG